MARRQLHRKLTREREREGEMILVGLLNVVRLKVESPVSCWWDGAKVYSVG